MTLAELRRAIEAAGDPATAAIARRFFKTGPGEYGEGDQFRGIKVPVLRRIARDAGARSLDEIEALLASPFHEDRFVALALLVRAARKANAKTLDGIARFYLRHVPEHINNWDLVDASAEHIVGPWLLARGADETRRQLDRLVRDRSLWRRRVAILTTFHFIRRGLFDETLRLAELCLDDEEDLIHKAVGWLLREVGKRDVARLRAYLHAHAARMPRTMLRYAIEKLPPAERARWMAMKAKLDADVPSPSARRRTASR